jgi:hypothetical protein
LDGPPALRRCLYNSSLFPDHSLQENNSLIGKKCSYLINCITFIINLGLCCVNYSETASFNI